MCSVCIFFLGKEANRTVIFYVHFISSCLQDIVGARFHCAICDSVDICSNCESAGLPGNLDPADGGHNSSHIMIKVSHAYPHSYRFVEPVF